MPGVGGCTSGACGLVIASHLWHGVYGRPPPTHPTPPPTHPHTHVAQLLWPTLLPTASLPARRAEQKAAQELKVLRKAGLSSSLADDEDESIRQSYRWALLLAALVRMRRRSL